MSVNIYNVTSVTFNSSDAATTTSLNEGPNGQVTESVFYTDVTSTDGSVHVAVSINSQRSRVFNIRRSTMVDAEVFADINFGAFSFRSDWNITNITANGSSIESFTLNFGTPTVVVSALEKYRPAFGGEASFSSVSNNVTFGDNHSQRNLKGLNSLKMSLSLQFNELKDNEARELITELKSHSHMSFKTILLQANLTIKELTVLIINLSIPIKNHFHCLTFNHEKPHYNINNINAVFESTSPSILSSVSLLQAIIQI